MKQKNKTSHKAATRDLIASSLSRERIQLADVILAENVRQKVKGIAKDARAHSDAVGGTRGYAQKLRERLWNGRRNISLENILALSRALTVKPGELLDHLV